MVCISIHTCRVCMVCISIHTYRVDEYYFARCITYVYLCMCALNVCTTVCTCIYTYVHLYSTYSICFDYLYVVVYLHLNEVIEYSL